MRPNHSPEYVQSDNSLDVAPPYFFPNVDVQGFVIEADLKAVQKYCDDFLNLGTREERGFEYRAVPAWPFAQLLFLHYPVMISAAPDVVKGGNGRDSENPIPSSNPDFIVPMADRGTTSQNEVFAAIPVMRYGVGPKGLLVESELEWILPFIVVDQPWSCVCGREMLGLGKMMSRIDIGPGYLPGSFLGEVHMPGWDGNSPEMQHDLPFLYVQTGPALPTFRATEPLKSLATAFQAKPVRWALEKIAGLSNFVDDASLGLVPTTMQTVALKQYRDAVDPECAVYQALVGCRSKYSEISNLDFYDERDIWVMFNYVGSFREAVDVILGDELKKPLVVYPELDKTVSITGRMAKVVGAFKFSANVDFDDMRVLHEFDIRKDRKEGGHGQVLKRGSSDLTARWFRPLKGFFGPRPMP
ncbi:hypothetical protein [Qipengyuania soli]|uniref:Uncharacterized protein n=1 Tax=Qipengyuania soli TaxID=2782568 RepID=A0A7S8F258_9SPHN|nr:hypothetical protein [Qipengyuania soli]QPC99125.1 hypothetical protein IRL76_00625 [Qipengyuania soli]